MNKIILFRKNKNIKIHGIQIECCYSWLLTCDEILNGSNKRFAVTWRDDIGLRLKVEKNGIGPSSVYT